MNILYFAWLRERIGVGSETIEPPESVATAGDLAEWLRGRGPRYEAAFADLAAVRVAIDQSQVELDAPIKGAREIAFFPPMTGG